MARTVDVSVHEMVRLAGVAELLDKAKHHLASVIDFSDTDESLERVQTNLTLAITAAIQDVIREELARHGL